MTTNKVDSALFLFCQSTKFYEGGWNDHISCLPIGHGLFAHIANHLQLLEEASLSENVIVVT